MRSSIKKWKPYKTKIESLELKKKRNPRAEEYNDRTEKFYREFQKQTQLCRGKDQKTQG